MRFCPSVHTSHCSSSVTCVSPSMSPYPVIRMCLTVTKMQRGDAQGEVDLKCWLRIHFPAPPSFCSSLVCVCVCVCVSGNPTKPNPSLESKENSIKLWGWDCICVVTWCCYYPPGDAPTTDWQCLHTLALAFKPRQWSRAVNMSNRVRKYLFKDSAAAAASEKKSAHSTV